MSEKTIYIPSKRIYNNENPKILKNKYSSYSIKTTSSSRSINVKTDVKTIEESENLSEIQDTPIKGYTGSDRLIGLCECEDYTWGVATGEGQQLYHVVSYSGIDSNFHSVSIFVPKKQNYNLNDVIKVYSGKNEEESGSKYDISVSITNKVYTTPFTIVHGWNVQESGTTGSYSNLRTGETIEEAKTDLLYELTSFSTNVVVPYGNFPKTYTSTVEIENITKMYNSESYTVCEETDSGYNINIVFQTRIRTTSATALKNFVYGTKYDEATLKGQIVEKVPQKINVTIYGDVYEFVTDDIVYENTSDSTNVFNPDSNELFQDKTTVGNEKIDEYMSGEIVSSWKNGKETAEITCSYNDYKEYDIVSQKSNGTNAISISDSTKPFQFDIGDVVCPQKATVSGDKPISTFKSGQYTLPKLFAVTGKGVKYDGALWQNLSLQETYPSFNINVLKNSNAITILNKTVTSSRAVEDQSAFDDCLHYGDNAIVEFSCASDYTFSNSNSGKYKSISMTTGTPNKININSVLGDIDVYLYADYNMLGPIFYSVTSDGTTWAFREIRNGNPTEVSCNVKVYNGAGSSADSNGIEIAFPNGKFTATKRPYISANPESDPETTHIYYYSEEKTYTYPYEVLRVNGITLTSSFQTIRSIGSGADYTKWRAKYDNGTLTLRSEYSEGTTLKSADSKTIFIPIYTGTFYAEQVLVAEETFTIPAYSNDYSYEAQRSICSGNVGVDGKTTIDTTFTTTTSVGETYTKNVTFTIGDNLVSPQINYAEYDGSSEVYVEIYNPNPFNVYANLAVYYSDGNMYGSATQQMQAYETAEITVDVSSSLGSGSEVEAYFSYSDETFQDSYNEYATIE